MPHGFQEAECAGGEYVGRELGDLKTDLDVALRSEVVDLVGAEIIEENGERTAVGEVGLMEEKARTRLVDVLIDVVEPAGVEAGGTALAAVDSVTFGKEELAEVGAVVAGAAGD